ncbi:MerR family transcriptional regulator [Vibrio salinus]|uniref:MerR family transcriptional regulator n=1 Tax=Vibrio salinus TaxID=2899784 RepID=UPI001E57C30F|nr:MerR family transcriptional regulator [Vibrio salinus]MCE0492457.1 MerR family transcriptional regulator [Vibrio salinus]
MFIGEVSKSTGASPKAIRLYETLGLLTQIPRQGRYRIYDQSDIEFIKLIKEAQSLGITLSDFKALVVGRLYYYRWFQGNSAVKQIKRTIFDFCGFKSISTTYIGPVLNSSPVKKAGWLKKISGIAKKNNAAG